MEGLAGEAAPAVVAIDEADIEKKEEGHQPVGDYHGGRSTREAEAIFGVLYRMLVEHQTKGRGGGFSIPRREYSSELR